MGAGAGDGQRLRPTETTVYAAMSAPPVSGAALFVLDGWLRAVPTGVVGELYVAGRDVSPTRQRVA